MPEEVLMFVDFENLRYGMLNRHNIEPDLQAIAEKARKYGRPVMMRAYADFSEHPADLKTLLQVVGIEAISLPVKKNTVTKGGKLVERVKNAADMVLALDAMLQAVEADALGKVKTFLIVAGDRDYIKLVTLLRNRFGQRVVVCGVPGCVSHDLVLAAGAEDSLDAPSVPPTSQHDVRVALVAMVAKGPAPLQYWTASVIDQWSRDARQKIPGSATDRRDAISGLISDGVFVQQMFQDPKRGPKLQVILDAQKAKSLGYV